MSIKVVPRVKKFSPFAFVLDQKLRPGFHIGEDSLIVWCMIEYKMDRKTAERIVYSVAEYIEQNDLSYQDRDKLHLPNIKERYPSYPEFNKFWKT
ncbi:MAG: hypothetical protein IJX16_01825, partial [Clostridia bacterium]|nr:hypothetical protein [Clostridia bacterium]